MVSEAMVPEASGGGAADAGRRPQDSTFWNGIVRWLMRQFRTGGDMVTSAGGAAFGSARGLAITVVAAALVLRLVQSMLYVPSGWGIEDFLGWTDTTVGGPVDSMIGVWRRFGVLGLAQLYLILDAVLFVPLYTGFFIVAGMLLIAALGEDRGKPGLTPWWSLAFWLPVLMLAMVDLAENLLGMHRLGVPWWPALIAIVVAVALVASVPAIRQIPGRLRAAVGALAAAATAGLLWLRAHHGVCSEFLLADLTDRLTCSAHHLKLLLALLVLAVLALGTVLWLFAVMLRDRPTKAPDEPEPPEQQTPESEAFKRALLRSAIADCVGRSRYVLAALLLLLGLTVVMDQSRDVLASTASFLSRAHGHWIDGRVDELVGVLVGATICLASSVASVALLVFAVWLWTRSACHLMSARRRCNSGELAGGRKRPLHYEDIFARDWARGLALLPVFFVCLLSSQVLQDFAQSQTAGAGVGDAQWLRQQLPNAGVFVFVMLCVIYGARFIFVHSTQESQYGYYSCIDWRGWRERAGLLRLRPLAGKTGAAPSDEKRKEVEKYRFLWVIGPGALPVVSALLIFICRVVDVWPGRDGEYFPSLAFPIILLSLTFWLCVFGWLSMLEIQGAKPWFLALVVWIGVVGASGYGDNHLSWPGPLSGPADRFGGLWMLGATALLMMALLGIYLWILLHLRASADDAEPLRGFGIAWRVALLLAILCTVIFAGSFLAGNRMPGPVPPANTQAAPDTLDAAMRRWMVQLCNPDRSSTECLPAPDDSEGIVVNFVSSEGGGIRAAVWTAMVLQQQEARDNAFAQRTFSISGVSGGAVGAAVYRACSAPSVATEERMRCVGRFARTDLLSPLLSSWMFEDLVARFVPSGFCTAPGCGFMTRGAWFEQTMEVGAPRLRDGMLALRAQDAGMSGHVPYLLLNATWVESGERAIASELQITERDFPSSRDQIGLVGSDIPLGAAAHNAARFPYVNAIGGLKAPKGRCDHRGGGAFPVDAGRGDAAVCGHLADGGYFDNGGAESTIDVLRSFQRCLSEGDPCALGAHRLEWLRENLVPRVLMIRHEPKPGAAREDFCGEGGQPTAAQVDPSARSVCAGSIGDGYRPGRPLCSRGSTPYIDLLGPALAVFKTSGIGASGRLAEERQATAVTVSRAAVGGKAASSGIPAVITLDLLPEGVHFPLGWHLSVPVVQDMEAQSRQCQIATGLLP